MAQVTIEQGVLEGAFIENAEAKYYAFKGIPYAKPPASRFQASEPPEPWSGVLNATSHGAVCPQYNERLHVNEPGSEDCLFLNVYTPKIDPDIKLPVMVYIHGGGFYSGSGNSDLYGPEFIVAKDVVLVTFNYRLDVLGFLCLNVDGAPGNAGLKDQVSALKWVKKNIGAFGGDPQNVTIFGCSAGGASVTYHLISKLSEGLFNKAISQSGVCLNEWSYTLRPLERAAQLGQTLEQTFNDPTELLGYLKTVPVDKLVNVKLPLLTPTAQNRYMDLADTINFLPVIEKSSLAGDKFLTEPVVDVVENGGISNVPIMIGHATEEGIETVRFYNQMSMLLKSVGGVVPRELKSRLTDEQIQVIDQEIRKKYFQGRDIDEDTIDKLVDLHTDSFFAYNIRRFAKHAAKKSPVYFYNFALDTERNYTKKDYKMDQIKGVCHAEDVFYLFHVSALDVPLTDQCRRYIDQVVTLWTNFAKSGNPTSSGNFEEWKPFSEKSENVYVIDKDMKCQQANENIRIQFWDYIYSKANELSSATT